MSEDDGTSGLPAGAQPLGIGRMLSDSFSILFQRFPLLVFLAMIVQVVFVLLGLLLVQNPAAIVTSIQGGGFSVPVFLGALAAIIVFVAASTITNAMIVLAAYDARLGNPSRLGAYLGATLNAFGPIVGYSIMLGLGTLLILAVLVFVPAAMFGSGAAGIIGFIITFVVLVWLYVVLAVTVPSMVIEGSGLGGIGRSVWLTENYRWPVLIFVVVAGLIGGLFQMVVNGVIGQIAPVSAATLGDAGFGSAGWLALILGTIVSGITAAFSGVTLAVLFARLKEIKEGVGYDDLGSVFD